MYEQKRRAVLQKRNDQKPEQPSEAKRQQAGSGKPSVMLSQEVTARVNQLGLLTPCFLPFSV